jgi:3-oxoacyl-[acyl-carrier protein] reductase
MNILITGGAGGIGEAIAKAFAEKRCNLALQYNKSEDKASEIKNELEKTYGIKALTIKANLNKNEEIEALAKKSLSEFGTVDVLINNAGIAHQELFQLCDDEKVKEIFDVNIMSAMKLTKEILPSMIKNHRGRIINISSMWGICGASCEVHYSASKSALIGFTKALSKEVGPSGITVNCIAPGFIDTKMNAHLAEEDVQEIIDCTPMMRAGKGEDVAYLCEFLASDKASFITGQVISVDGGYSV